MLGSTGYPLEFLDISLGTIAGKVHLSDVGHLPPLEVEQLVQIDVDRRRVLDTFTLFKYVLKAH